MAKQKAQTVTGTQNWRSRMIAAKTKLKDLKVGHQQVLDWIVEEKPGVYSLRLATRWKNAWMGRVADPEFTELVERAANSFAKKPAPKSPNRLRRQGLETSSSN